MTETPGATNVMSQPIESLSPTDAQARRDALTADPAFQERIKQRDASAFDEAGKLWRIAHGMPLEPTPPVNAVDVMTESIGRALQEVQTRADGLRNDGFSEVQIYEYLNGRPIPLRERQDAERALASLKRDRAFQQRLNDADPTARYEWRRVHVNLSMPVGTQEQIRQWERAHHARRA
jgi:hypothetical protein